MKFNTVSTQILELPFGKRSYQTRIEITGFGGVVELGEIRKDVAGYWSKQDAESFGAHIFEKKLSVDQRIDGSAINPRRSRKNWGCICNVACIAGIEVSARVEIRATSDTGSVLLDFTQEQGATSWPIDQVDDRSFFQLQQRRRYAAGRSFGVMSCIFIVEDANAFDPDLMDLNLVQTGWGAFINSISYKGKVINIDDGCFHPLQLPIATVLQSEGQ